MITYLAKARPALLTFSNHHRAPLVLRALQQCVQNYIGLCKLGVHFIRSAIGLSVKPEKFVHA